MACCRKPICLSAQRLLMGVKRVANARQDFPFLTNPRRPVPSLPRSDPIRPNQGREAMMAAVAQSVQPPCLIRSGRIFAPLLLFSLVKVYGCIHRFPLTAVRHTTTGTTFLFFSVFSRAAITDFRTAVNCCGLVLFGSATAFC